MSSEVCDEFPLKQLILCLIQHIRTTWGTRSAGFLRWLGRGKTIAVHKTRLDVCRKYVPGQGGQQEDGTE